MWAKTKVIYCKNNTKKPKVLIFDDTTSTVDTKNDAKIRGDLKNKLQNTTKIIISQLIISLKDCDKIIFMDNGSISCWVQNN